MVLKDFLYANKRLSDYGYIVVSIVTPNENTVSLGSNLNFETIKNSSTFVNHIVKTNYDEPQPVTFDICKSPCGDNMNFSDGEISFIMRWFNQKKYHKFYPIYDEPSYPNIYFEGSFNVNAIYIGGNVVGFTLTFIPNSPFGYESEKNIIFNINKRNGKFVFFNRSDELGYLYPNYFVIKCKEDGEFLMTNNMDNQKVKISNCFKDEVITLDCKNKIITSNFEHPRLHNDFNYNYPRFIVDENTERNEFTVSLPCEINVSYSSIRKAGVIV